MRASVLIFLPLAAALIAVSCGRKTAPPGPPAPVISRSAACATCHGPSAAAWRTSHHALAHRDTGSVEDSWAFLDRSLKAGKAEWHFTGGAPAPAITWRDPAAPGGGISGHPAMAIGHRPLIQYVVDRGGGRYQVPDAAWDPVKQEWFSMFGNDQRLPHEWGNWTQRGMNWNSQCAYCHFTGFHKNHDEKTDTYASTWVEQDVGCAQCHGPDRANHAANGCRVDPKQKFTPLQWTGLCASCHARREEFDDTFTVGDNFYDHYLPALPNQPGLYYPDGQQIDEDYNYTSLMLSRMGHKGLSCIDCHDSHAATPKGGRAAVDNNSLCLQCHATGIRGAKVIDPKAHTFHKPGTRGDRCVDCHMPKKTYMARDPRSDHRFPSPDPLLTKELGVPNACNDCHQDKGVDWQIQWTEKWYGSRDRSAVRDRARAVAAAYANRPEALPMLVAAFDREETGAWQATLLRLMAPDLADPRVRDRAARAAASPDPLVRAAAAALLGQWPRLDDPWRALTRDPVRAVRLEAGWSGLERLPKDGPLITDLRKVAKFQADQPFGQMRLARIDMYLDNARDAEAHLRKAIDWDRGSPAALRELAVYLGGRNRAAEAVALLEEASRRVPNDPDFPYLASLALAETGDIAGAEKQLRKAIAIAPGHARSHYNLGLLLNSMGKRADAILELRAAADADAGDPAAPYALATIYLQLGQTKSAAAAAREALSRQPAHREAAELLRSLEKPGGR